MKTTKSSVLVLGALVALMSLSSNKAQAQTNFNLGLSASYGNQGYLPAFGLNGNAYGAIVAGGSCWGANGGWNGGGMPAMPMLPPPPQLIPPHLQGGGNFWGGGQVNACNMGCNAAWGPSQVVAVPGGPQFVQQQQSQVSSGYSVVQAGGTTIIDMREREPVDNTGDIIWATAVGLGLQTTNVYPFMGDRGNYTLPPFFFADGTRPTDLQPRPHASAVE